MNRLVAALARLGRDLDALGCNWALIGGMAVAVRAEPRTTRDLDVAVAVADDAAAERLVADLMRRGYRSFQMLEQTDAGRLATMRLSSPADPGDTIVDLLFASSGIEGEIAAAATEMTVAHGLRVPVARTGHLMTLKVLAGRAHDLADFGQLLQFADEGEVELAREAARILADRGFHRDKNLLAELDRLIELGPDRL